MPESKAHRKQVQDALNDARLQTALHRAVGAYKTARGVAMNGFDLAASQVEVRALKERAISDLDGLFGKFKVEAEKVGAVVHEAANADAAAEIVRGLARDRGVKLIVKSKSMLTEELELNRRLGESGLEVVETDLGEWIIQLAGEKPSHFTAPAMHKTREQVAELFSKVTGEELSPDVQELVAVARRRLRQAFVDADMGISGANVAIAETGGIVIVANEGNDRLVTTLPPIHVAIVGYEKLVGTLDDANAILKVLSKSGTGQKQTAYVSFITGPSRTTDIEKTLALGVHGPKELHIIFVDAGRKAMAADSELKEALYCIKCGACLNLCPAYGSIGGHAYGNAYMGGIGSVVTAHHRSLEASEDTLALCTGCGYCTSICPSKIDTPAMVLELRRRLVEKHGLPMSEHVVHAGLRNPSFLRKSLSAARVMQPAVTDACGMIRNVPILSGMLGGRHLPGLSGRFLRDTLPESAGSGAMTVSLYAGCMLEYVYPEIGEAIWRVLSTARVRALFAREQCCCGAPALYSGDQATAGKLAADNIEALMSGSPDYIVTGCPTCAVMLKERFPSLLAGTGFEPKAVALANRVMDFSQFAREVLNLQPAGTSGGKVTYHDPCHQVRGLRTSQCSRDIIAGCGAKLTEMEEPDQCCGFAGSYSIKQSGISLSILNRKIAHIRATGADCVATDCPGCIMQIRGGLSNCGSDIKVRHTAQILAESLE